MQLEDYAKVLTHVDMALANEQMAPAAFRYKTVATVELGDTAAWLNLCKEGTARFPEDAYFSQSLIQYYDSHGLQDQLSALADEGMWMLPLLQKMNADAMKELGCELTPKQIYDINNSSLKDAIVQFGRGCTGEIISKEGLLVTNHHCGYGNIQKLSSVEHDYLKDGFWAMNRNEELPCEGLTVTFLEYVKDVTPVIDKAIKKARKEFGDDEKKVEEAQVKAMTALAEKAEKEKKTI